MHSIHTALSRFLADLRIGRDARIVVGVSGGADSVALLYAMSAIGQRVAAGHVHHGLRGAEAEADLQAVREHAHTLGVPFRLRRVDARPVRGQAPEATARSLRYAALEQIREEIGGQWVASAHTLDDQAETVLLRAVRGAAPEGLAGIAPVCVHRRLLRPLLDARRGQLREYLLERDISWREDATNADLAVPRNRLRHEVLPSLERVHPGATAKLAQLAVASRESAAGSVEAIGSWLGRCTEPGDGGHWIDLERLDRAEPRLRRAVLRRVLLGGGPPAGGTRRHVLRLEAFLDGEGSRLSLPGARVAQRDRGAVWIGPGPGPRFPGARRTRLRPPESLELPERRWMLRWQPRPQARGAARGLVWPDASAAALYARGPQPDDLVRPTPGGLPRALKDVFARARWSNRDRAHALVIEADGEIAWVPGLLPPVLPASHGEATGPGWELLAERIPSC